MIELNKLEKKHNFNSKKLSEILPDFYKYTNTINNPDYKPFLAEIHFNVLINYFEQIINITAKELKIKEEYEIYSSEKSEIIAKVGFVSSNFEFTIGLFRDLYLIWEIKNPDSIKNMKDEFWTLLFEFSKLGKFQYKEKLVDLPNLKKKHPNLFNKRSNFYKLFRNYYLTQTEYKKTRELGFLNLEWDNNMNPEEYINKLISAIEIIYKLNKMLVGK